MKPVPRILALAAAALVTSLGTAAPLRILYFTKSSGYEHSVIKVTDGKPSHSDNILAALAARNDWTVTASKDGSRFAPDYLRQFDVVIFYTSGDLLAVGTDGEPAMTAAGKQALLDSVRAGLGFVALHSGTDTFHTHEHGGGNPANRGPRYRNYGDEADPYVRMIGGEFIKHGPQQRAAARVVAPDFPGFGGLGPEVRTMEEWYTLKEFAPDDHVLLVMQTAGMKGGDYARPDYPLAWVRRYGKGRVAVNAMGHREDVWDSPAYQAMLVGMIGWAGGRVAADITPNLEIAAPGHATLQPEPAGKPDGK